MVEYSKNSASTVLVIHNEHTLTTKYSNNEDYVIYGTKLLLNNVNIKQSSNNF